MLKHLLTLSLVILCFAVTGQNQTGNLDDYLQQAIDDMPGKDGNDLQKSNNSELAIWERTVNFITDNQLAQARASADSINYKVLIFTDTTMAEDETFQILQEKTPAQNHWGIYVFNPEACRDQLVLQSVHPKFDLNTGDEGVFCFKRLSAKALFLSGTHRCNHSDISPCSGTTSVCGGSDERYRISDMAHYKKTVFQRTTSILKDDGSNPTFVQLHGFAKGPDDPFVIMSNGTREEPSNDPIAGIKNELGQIDTSLTFKVAHQDTSWDRLIGFTNVQGRLINGSNNPCKQGASSSEGRFIHIEQEKSKLRDDTTGWHKMYQALAGVFKCDTTTNITPEPKASSGIKVSPNPTSGEIHLSPKKIQSVEVFNSNGQMVKEISFQAYDERRLNLKKMPIGIYFLRVQVADTFNMKKIILMDR